MLHLIVICSHAGEVHTGKHFIESNFNLSMLFPVKQLNHLPQHKLLIALGMGWSVRVTGMLFLVITSTIQCSAAEGITCRWFRRYKRGMGRLDTVLVWQECRTLTPSNITLLNSMRCRSNILPIHYVAIKYYFRRYKGEIGMFYIHFISRTTAELELRLWRRLLFAQTT